MKKIALGLFVTSMAFTSSSIATTNVCINNYGSMECSAGEVDSINHLGDLNMSGTHVLGDVKVIGNMEANNANIGSSHITGIVEASNLTVQQKWDSVGKMKSTDSIFNGEVMLTGGLKGKNDTFNQKVDIIGDVKINNAVFKKEAQFTGILNATTSTFMMPIKIDSCDSTFNHSTINSITVSYQRNCFWSVEKIHLQDQTIVKGDIQFASGNGKVYLTKNSSINGHVIGGTIIRE